MFVFPVKVLADQLKGSRGVSFSRASVGSIGSPADLLGSSASSSSSQGLPTHKALVELCCGPARHLSAAALNRGLRAHRVTQQSHNLLTAAGRRKVVSGVKDLLADGDKVNLWVSLPCRPWTLWNECNQRKYGKDAKVTSKY